MPESWAVPGAEAWQVPRCVIVLNQPLVKTPREVRFGGIEFHKVPAPGEILVRRRLFPSRSNRRASTSRT